MSEIKFMEKPEWVSWDDVRICLNVSHKTNKKKGFEMRNSTITTDDLLQLMKDAHCYIALVDNKVVGVSCFKIMNMRKWYAQGPVVYYFGDAILPEYRGTDVYFGLVEIKEKAITETGVKIRLFRTSANNRLIIKMNERYGYKLVQFQPTKKKDGNYYQVAMMKWDEGCPFPDWFLRFMFNLSKFVTKTFFRRKS